MDRTAAPRPRPQERPAPHAVTQSPGADAFAELLGAQAPSTPQPRPEPREGNHGGRRGESDEKGFESSLEGRSTAGSQPPPTSQPGAVTGAQGQPGAVNGAQGQPGAVNGAAPGFGGPLGQAGPLTAAAKAEIAAATGIMGQLGPGGVETATDTTPTAPGAPTAGVKLPSVPAMPVPAPPEGKAATPAGWLGPKAAELKPTPAVAPPPQSAPVAAPAEGKAATPSGWRGPDTQAPGQTATATTPAPIQTATPAPTTTSTPAPQPTSTTPLAHAPSAVSALLQVAHERGISRARINLRPVELGGIEVRLHATAAGISAHLIADSPEAAKLLAQAGDELRRNLEQRDVNLLSLQVSTSADHNRDAPNGRTAPEADDFRSSVSPRADRDGDTADAPRTTTTSTIELPGGLLVDVLA